MAVESFCNNCGAKAQSGVFCSSCGTKLATNRNDADALIEGDAQTVPTRQPPMRLALIVGAIVIAVVLVPVGINAFTELQTNAAEAAKVAAQAEKEKTFFNNVAANCGVFNSFAVTIETDGSSMFVSGYGDEDVIGMPIDDLVCVITGAGVPQTVIDRMNTTTSLMGIQEASWDDLSASWSYHPDNGLDINFEFQG